MATVTLRQAQRNLVKKTKPDGSKTIYPSTTPQRAAASLRAGSGSIYEVDKTSGGSVTRAVTYYPAAGAMSKIPRPAGRINISGGSNSVYYILKDHLGSASVVTDASGNPIGEQRYYPYGETRFTSGTLYTDKLFTCWVDWRSRVETGQREVDSSELTEVVGDKWFCSLTNLLYLDGTERRQL